MATHVPGRSKRPHPHRGRGRRRVGRFSWSRPCPGDGRRLRPGRRAPRADARQGLQGQRRAPLVRRRPVLVSQRPGGRGREFVLVDAAAGTRRPAFDHAKLADGPGPGHRRRRTRRTACRSTASRSPTTARSASRPDGKAWRYDPEADALEPGEPLGRLARADASPPRRGAAGPAAARSPRQPESPDGRWVAVVKDHNIHLRDKETGEEFALSTERDAEDGRTSGASSGRPTRRSSSPCGRRRGTSARST